MIDTLMVMLWHRLSSAPGSASVAIEARALSPPPARQAVHAYEAVKLCHRDSSDGRKADSASAQTCIVDENIDTTKVREGLEDFAPRLGHDHPSPLTNRNIHTFKSDRTHHAHSSAKIKHIVGAPGWHAQGLAPRM
jgi:hypothetical protein